jgi:4a-hydroxytetrahydrobiopterin dehydratase
MKSILRNKESFARLKRSEIQKLRTRVPAWRVVKHHHLSKSYSFPDFKKALAFVNKIGKIAERLGHHPDVYLTFSKVDLKIFDHKTNGLINLDFVLADRIDKISKNRR